MVVFTISHCIPRRALNDLMIARLQFHYNIHKAIFNSENNMKINKEMVKWQQRKTLNALYAHIIIIIITITRTIVEFTNKMKPTSEKNNNNNKNTVKLHAMKLVTACGHQVSNGPIAANAINEKQLQKVQNANCTCQTALGTSRLQWRRGEKKCEIK